MSFISSPALALYQLLYRHILEPESKRLQNQVDAISRENIVRGSPSSSMMVRGVIMSASSRAVGMGAKPVHPELEERLWQLHLAMKSFAVERNHIRHVTSFIIPDEYDEANYRNALSDVVVNMIPRLKNLPRTKPECWFIMGQEAKMNQYFRARDTLEYYIGNLLVFS